MLNKADGAMQHRRWGFFARKLASRRALFAVASRAGTDRGSSAEANPCATASVATFPAPA
jgi:hypothetical protein